MSVLDLSRSSSIFMPTSRTSKEELHCPSAYKSGQDRLRPSVGGTNMSQHHSEMPSGRPVTTASLGFPSTPELLVPSTSVFACYDKRDLPPLPYPKEEYFQSRDHEEVGIATDASRKEFFNMAHHFTIEHAYMYDGIPLREWVALEEEKKANERAFEKLTVKGMPAAMLDSIERGYIPRCDEFTRQSSRDHILSWAKKAEGSRRMLWLSGPAGIGKSAIAQTVSEELRSIGLLGAVFFFSRPNKRSDPNVVIPTLAYQLALQLPQYRRVISFLLAKNPLILNQSRRTQFEQLISIPLLYLDSRQHLLIVLDGLDECDNRDDAQREFVEMISHHIRSAGCGLRTLWMVCSRPEPDISHAFVDADCAEISTHEVLVVDNKEAQHDTLRVLLAGFANIRRRYPDELTENWPADHHIRLIAAKASGHLGFVSFIIRFISDRDYDDPYGQLDVCVKFLQAPGNLEKSNPLLALDLLYTQILSDVPAATLPTTQDILAILILYRNKHLNTLVLANFLGLHQASFFRALRRLHSVLLIPPASEAGKRSIQIYHASFSDYLMDPARSGEFAIKQGPLHLKVAMRGLEWIRFGHQNTSEIVALPELTWIPPTASREDLRASLCRFSFTPCWTACPQIPEHLSAPLITALERFDFHLDYVKWWKEETEYFSCFVRWLASLHADKNMVIVNGWYTLGDVIRQGEVVVCRREDDPLAFVSSFVPDVVEGSFTYSVQLLLGKSNPTAFRLVVRPLQMPCFR
ncbi:hypothetical protein NP233_g12894 [Leucocoprinus birnbaumii]|uniref:NACHT domain-containing protein n=1 Tax=Leucocoprinus birnbaumii TaxID=56174 RepID=A0AAD5VDX2_9AGAR|nr:hypothetical protein NP233_g12894 [Leucocoprinus birnbaumii]